MNLPKGVKLIQGSRRGPSVAIFAGVHGNERAGIYALENIAKNLRITRGKVFLVFANELAIQANVRSLNKNLNRCFYENNNGNTYEDLRARELMRLLDDCSALLDLHMFHDELGEPFVICEDNAVNVAKIFDVKIISTNWSATEPGASDGYMYMHGKLGICLECGPISKSVAKTPYAERSIYQFLRYFNMGFESVSYSATPKRIVKATKTVYKTKSDFQLIGGFKNFQPLKENQIIAKDGTKIHKAKAGECIIFPRYNAQIGEEAFIIGKSINRIY